MEKFPRIQLGKIKELFKKTGVKPSQRNYKGCILAACMLANNPADFEGGTYKEQVEDVLGFSHSYQEGLMDGWDGLPMYGSYHINDIEYNLGHADGTCAWSEVNEGTMQL